MTLRQRKRLSRHAPGPPSCAISPPWRISITEQPAGLDRTLFLKLAGCDWIHEHRHCLLTGPCGARQILVGLRPRLQGMPGKTFSVAVSSTRPTRLFTLLALGRGDGRYTKLMCVSSVASTYSFSTIGVRNRCCPSSSGDLLEIVEDRYNAGSLDHHQPASRRPMSTSSCWKSRILADAILDRIIHNAYRVELSGESLRKPRASA